MRRLHKVSLLGGICGLVLTMLLFARAMVGVISAETTSNNGDCNVPSASYLTIRDAVTDTTCTTINVASGIYTETLAINRSLTIRGQALPTETLPIINGNDNGPVVSISGSEAVTLADMKITNGSATEGGGIHNNGAQLWLLTITIEDNEATERGGGIFNQNNGQILATNLTITGNQALGSGNPLSKNGGGLSADTGFIQITDSIISNNESNNGGGFNVFAALVELTNVIFVGNKANPAFGAGGGIHAEFSAVTISNSQFQEHQAGNGGGIKLNNAQATISKTTVTDNSAGSGAGVNIASNFAVTIAQSVIASNTASGNGGGVFAAGAGTKFISVAVYANTSGTRGGGFYNAGFTTVEQSTVSHNAAADSGTAFAHDFGTLEFRNSTLSDNCHLAAVRGDDEDECDDDDDDDGDDEDDDRAGAPESGVRFIGSTFVDGRGSGGHCCASMGHSQSLPIAFW